MLCAITNLHIHKLFFLSHRIIYAYYILYSMRAIQTFCVHLLLLRYLLLSCSIVLFGLTTTRLNKTRPLLLLLLDECWPGVDRRSWRGTHWQLTKAVLVVDRAVAAADQPGALRCCLVALIWASHAVSETELPTFHYQAVFKQPSKTVTLTLSLPIPLRLYTVLAILV